MGLVVTDRQIKEFMLQTDSLIPLLVWIIYFYKTLQITSIFNVFNAESINTVFPWELIMSM